MRTRFNPKAETVYFRTFEAREAAFNQAVGSLIPIKYRGPQRFWEDFRRLTSEQRLAPEHLPAFITSNPRDCLAFGSTAQVLAAARLVARRGDNGNPLSVEDVADAFGLSQALTQPIRTLSGGETVRLALAKTVLAAGGSERLVIGSPFCWMSHNHVPLLDRVVDHYADAGRTVTLLAMAGEDSRLPMEQAWVESGASNGPDFTLTLEGVRIRLGTPINALTARPVFAGVDDYCAKMTSPCLVVGDNGQGKSLLAKALSGAAGHSGTARMEAAGTRGRARLLFQDVITQTLLRSLADINRSASRTAPYKPDEIEKAIFLRFCDLLREVGSEQTTWEQDGAQTLLAVKAALIAVRLAEHPAALFLDEPDWGLCRTDAIAFVLAVVAVSHGLGVPVLIISHKPWWRPAAASVLTISKQPGKRPDCRFHITLAHRENGLFSEDRGGSSSGYSG